jgi:hypothetical protein
MTSGNRLLSALRYHPGGSYCPGEHGKFVLVFLSRTGSNLLAGMLDSHPEILCHHELFNDTEIHRSLSYKGTNLDFGTVEERDRDPYEFLRRVFAFSGGKKKVGFKIAPGQNKRVLLSLLLNRRVKKIVLRRRGLLHAYTSEMIAYKTHVWSVPESAKDRPKPAEKVTVEVDDFVKFLRKRQLFYRLVRLILFLTFQRGLFVDYEDLQDQQTLEGVLRFLNASTSTPLKVRTERQNSPNLADRIDNYEELKAALASTQFAKYLAAPQGTTG